LKASIRLPSIQGGDQVNSQQYCIKAFTTEVNQAVNEKLDKSKQHCLTVRQQPAQWTEESVQAGAQGVDWVSRSTKEEGVADQEIARRRSSPLQLNNRQPEQFTVTTAVASCCDLLSTFHLQHKSAPSPNILRGLF
jgi:hypothetical protein